MRRRQLLGAAAGGLAASGLGATVSAPAVAQGAAARTLRIVPQANLTSLDPVWTTATITRTHSYLVYDTILSVDENFEVKPQAADGWQIEDDGNSLFAEGPTHSAKGPLLRSSFVQLVSRRPTRRAPAGPRSGSARPRGTAAA